MTLPLQRFLICTCLPCTPAAKIDLHLLSGVYLSDLTFTEDGNADKIEHLINFGKRRLVYRYFFLRP